MMRCMVGLCALLVLGGCDWDADAHVAKAPHRALLGAHPKKAPAAMRRYGCISCHTIPGVKGARARVGPSLDKIRERHFIAGRFANEPDMLMRWIQDPRGLKPHTAMPNMGVTDEDARNIAAYLYGLK
jgi:cytochrome c